MKKTLALLLAVLMMVSVIPFAAAVEDHTHIDATSNGVCDYPGCTETHEHADENGNGVCDYNGCTAAVEAAQPEEPTHTHKDNNGNGICDEAGCTEATTEHDHADANSNGVCDYPGCKVTVETQKPDDGDNKPTKPTTGYDYNSTYHWIVLNGVKVPNSAERHNFAKNGKCKECGYYNKNYDRDDYYGYGDYRVYLTDSGKGDTAISTYYADAGEYV